MQTSLYGLAQLLNVDPKREIELTDQVSFFDTPAIQVDQSLEAAYANRPEMKALLHAQRQVELAKRQAAESRYPTLTFDGYWAEQGLTPATAIPTYTYGFNFNVPLFTGGRIGAQRARADLELRKVVAAGAGAAQSDCSAGTHRHRANGRRAQRSGCRQSSRGPGERRGDARRAIDSRPAWPTTSRSSARRTRLARANDNQIVALYRYNQARADLARATGQMEAVYARVATRGDSMETQMMEDRKPVDEQPAAAVVRRPANRTRALLVILGGGLVVILVAAGAWLHYRDRISSDDAQVDGDIYPISAKVFGSVLDVPVKDNQQVKAGDVLVRIDPRDLAARVDQEKAALALAESQAKAANVTVPHDPRDHAQRHFRSVRGPERRRGAGGASGCGGRASHHGRSHRPFQFGCRGSQ